MYSISSNSYILRRYIGMLFDSRHGRSGFKRARRGFRRREATDATLWGLAWRPEYCEHSRIQSFLLCHILPCQCTWPAPFLLEAVPLDIPRASLHAHMASHTFSPISPFRILTTCWLRMGRDLKSWPLPSKQTKMFLLLMPSQPRADVFIREDLAVLSVFQHSSVDDIPKGARYRGRMRCGLRPMGSLLTRKRGIGVAVAFDSFWRLQRQVGLFLLSNAGCLGLSWGLIWDVQPRCRTWCTLSPCTQS